jgi:LacI family transcriptional regulator
MRLGAELLAAADAPTALLCATDRLAVGALHAIRAAGLRPGHDVSVIGHDDLPLATYTDPPLTTVAQPIERAAQRMVEMLLAILDGADPASLSEVWLPTLVPRASDGPPPPQAQQRASQETIRQKGTIHDGPKPPRA